jgi:hypothetical protein
MPGRRSALIVLASLVLGGCTTVGEARIVSSRPAGESQTVDREPAAPASPVEPDDTTAPPSTDPPTTPTDEMAAPSTALIDIDLADVIDLGGLDGLTADDRLLAAAISDIGDWAVSVLDGVYGIDDDPVSGGIHAGHPDRGDPLPGCGEDETDYEELTEYVALYCRGDDFVAVDAGEAGLLGRLVAEHGPLTIAVVIAHEFGHAIQDRIGALDLRLPTVVTEQQADCLAGAWLGRTATGGSTALRTGSDAVRAGLIALINVRDPLGVATTTPGGHGTAFDRVGAFQDGFAGGAEACAPLLDAPRDLMPNEFTSLDDYLRAGNAPYDCSRDPDPDCQPSWEFLGADLDEFWSLAVDRTVALSPLPVDTGRTGIVGECPDAAVVDEVIAVCAGAGTVLFDESLIRPLYDEVGDFSLGYLLGAAWAEAVLGPAGPDGDPSERVLRRDYLTGVWVADITTGRRRDPRRESSVVTSPGDLDEAITTIITLDSGVGPDAVDRIDAFRSGVLDGPAACD